jgi:hypothetical protein
MQGGHFTLIKISQELITVNYDIKIAWDLFIKLQQQKIWLPEQNLEQSYSSKMVIYLQNNE